MKKLTCIIAIMFSMTAAAQQNLSFGQGQQLVSPQINDDNTVTFRMSAPGAPL